MVRARLHGPAPGTQLPVGQIGSNPLSDDESIQSEEEYSIESDLALVKFLRDSWPLLGPILGSKTRIFALNGSSQRSRSRSVACEANRYLRTRIPPETFSFDNDMARTARITNISITGTQKPLR